MKRAALEMAAWLALAAFVVCWMAQAANESLGGWNG